MRSMQWAQVGWCRIFRHATRPYALYAVACTQSNKLDRGYIHANESLKKTTFLNAGLFFIFFSKRIVGPTRSSHVWNTDRLSLQMARSASPSKTFDQRMQEAQLIWWNDCFLEFSDHLPSQSVVMQFWRTSCIPYHNRSYSIIECVPYG